MPATPPPPPAAGAPKRSAVARMILERFAARKQKVAPAPPAVPEPPAPSKKGKTIAQLRAEVAARKKREELAKPRKAEAKVVEVMPRGYRELREKALKRKLRRALIDYISEFRFKKDLAYQMDLITGIREELEQLELEGLRQEGTEEENLPDTSEELEPNLKEFVKLRLKEKGKLYSTKDMRMDVEFWLEQAKHFLPGFSEEAIAEKVAAYNKKKPASERIEMREDGYDPKLIRALQTGAIKL